MALYRAARERNVLVSPGNFFRTDDGVRDAWMRVNVSLCEGTTLTRGPGILRAAARLG
jgi:DNA-binding transcriptional MocR family regulator